MIKFGAMEVLAEKNKAKKRVNKLRASAQGSKNFFVEKGGKKMLVETESAQEIMQRRNPAYKFLM